LSIDDATTAGILAAAEWADEAVIVTEPTLDAPGPAIRYVNPAFERLTGYAREEVLGATPRILQGPRTDRNVLDRLRRRLSSGRAFTGNVVNYHRDGEPFLMEWRVRPFRINGGELGGYVSVQRAVHPDGAGPAESPEALHRQIFRQHAIPMLLIDPGSGAIVDANEGAEAFYGLPLDQLRRMNIREINMLSDDEVRAEMDRARSERSGYFVFRHRLAGGEIRAVEVHSSPVTVAGREYLHSIVHDITERDALADEVRRRLYYDPLTELPNRALFHERLTQALGQAQARRPRLAVLLIDVDRFRKFNHVWGQRRADELLRRIGERVHEILTPEETLARTGADEFAILMPRLAAHNGPRRLAGRLHKLLRRPFRLAGREVYLTASIGAAIGPDHAAEATELFDCADATVLQIKRAGGDGAGVFDADQARLASDRVLLANDLSAALAAGGLQLACQPVVHLPTGAAHGVEVLVRWQDPARGWVSPEAFVTVAEESGQIAELGRWVLRAAARCFARHGGAGDGRVAVNVSVHQLRGSGFIDEVLQALRETGLPAGRLELELTESAFVEEAPRVIEQLERLRAEGISIAIDDFGTGFSSLQYLKRLPIDRIKIDRAFVTGIDGDEDNQALVATIVELARRFGLELTAEGIETEAEARTLVELGCTWGQGFLFARPQLLQ
jgi:diguanylate cyclase (GGDEF)-like protein/PAS domain S-box-containing protein